ncbi:MAG: Uma2 family endonuclease [Alkalinema sp. RU_4_3]|nr:Uma2 family endonuclease [Alkalinema sp. RU_4_3]
MVTQVPIPSPTELPLAEERVILRNISWETFERLLEESGDNRNTRFHYLDGTLEIMSPLFVHEGSNRFIAALIEAAADVLDMNLRRAGSVTLRQKPKKAGAEPDSSFYIQSEPLVRHLTELDLKKDPPPDLVVEVDITSSSDRRFPIYARLGIPELWQFDGKTIQYYLLQDDEYVPVQISPTFPTLQADMILKYLKERLDVGESQAIRSFKAELQQLR